MKTLLVGNSDCTCLLTENLLITREIKRSNGPRTWHTCRRKESKELLLLATADQRFDLKVKCPPWWVSFGSDSPLYRAKLQSNVPGIPGAGEGGID